MKTTTLFMRLCAVLCICSLLLPCVFAQEFAGNEAYHFTGAEFGEDAAACGIFIAGAPEEEDCALTLGSRVIRAGDFLPPQALSELVLQPCRDEDAQITITYRPIVGGLPAEECQLTMNIVSSRDDAPVAQNGKLQTYRNIANTGHLEANDPEGQPLTFHIENQPRRGSVEVNGDGSFVYTPKKNKVGEDFFTFTASDPAGNVSEVKTVQIEILKAVDSETFSDLDETMQFKGLWLRANGLFGGERLADRLCFCPEREVTRGEFLVMAMKAADVQPEIGLFSSGFVDQEDAPKWMQSYLVSAMRRGIVSGVPTDAGLCFLPDRVITGAEAAAIVANICHLETAQSASAEDDAFPVWAQSAMCAADAAGLPLPDTAATLTRADTASLIYAMAGLLTE